MANEAKQEPSSFTRLLSGRLLGLLGAAIVVVAGFLVSWTLSRMLYAESGNPLGELLISFGPSALFASGRGMILPLEGMPPELEAFLTGEAAAFDPRHLSDMLSGPHIFGPYADTFTLTHWLLFYAVGWTWRIFGISASSLHLLAGFMGGFAGASLYLLFRLGMGRILSCLGALSTLLLPPFLMIAPSLRDFSKAPFILLFIALAGNLLVLRRGARAYLAMTFVMALLLGAGFGFRQDMLICLPVALGVLAVAPLRGGCRPFLRFGAMALLALLFWTVSAPVLRGMQHESGSVTTHTLFQGLSRESEQIMGFGDADYDLLLTPSDPEVHAVVNAHVRMRGETEPMSLYLSPAYARAGRELFKEWARAFPADLFARGLASIESVMRLTGITRAGVSYTEIRHATETWPVQIWHDLYARVVEPLGILLFLGALFVIGQRGKALVFYALIILGYFMAYPSLLFHVRHAFHLAFIIPWALLFLAERGGTALVAKVRAWVRNVPVSETRPPCSIARSTAATAGVILVPVLGALLLLTGLRLVQTHTVSELTSQYRNAALAPVDTVVEDEGDHYLIRPRTALPGLEESWNLPTGDAATAYLALSFEPADFAFPVHIQYRSGQGPYFTRQFVVPAARGDRTEMLYLAPLYELADFTPAEFHVTKNRHDNAPIVNLLVHRLGTNTFSGIGLRKDALPLLKNIYYVDRHTDLPWLLYLRLPGEDRGGEPFKRLHWEKNLRALPLEARHWLKRDTPALVAGYLNLLSRFPGHMPYIHRTRKRLPLLESDAARAEVLFTLSGYEMHSGGRYAIELADLAGALRDRGAFTDAEAVYRKAIALAPGDYWHQAHLADMLFEEGNHEAAFDLYVGILRSAPESPHSARMVNEVFRETNREADILEFWLELRRNHPGARVPAMGLAGEYERLGLLDKAADLYAHLLEAADDNGEALLRYGVVTALRGDYAAGRVRLDQVVENRPDLKDQVLAELQRVAEHYAASGRHEAADAVYRDLVALAPQDLRHAVALADALADRGEAAAAAEQYKAVLAQAPESPQSAGSLDNLLATLGNGEQRLQFWRALCQSHPDAATPQLYLGIASEAMGDYDAAGAAYRRARANAPENTAIALRLGVFTALHESREAGIAMIRNIAGTDPDDRPAAADALAAIAENLKLEPDRGDIGGLYREAVDLAPENPWHRIHLGEYQLEQGAFQEALSTLEPVVREHPDMAHAAALLDACLQQRVALSERIAFWQDLCNSHPETSVPWFRLGMALEDAEDHEAALAACERALRNDPENAVAALRHGVLTANLGEWDAGLARIRSTAASNPDLRNQAATALADIAARDGAEGRHDEAEALYREAITLAPENLWHRVRLGELYRSRGLFDKALDAFSGVVEAWPNSPYTSDQIDGIYLEQRNPSGRLAFWEDIARRHPETAIPLYHLGLALEGVDRFEEALAMYQQAVASDPGFEPARERLEQSTPVPE